MLKILIAEDDPDDRDLAQEALSMTGLASEVRFVENGQELMDYLNRGGAYADREPGLPDLLLLDLNMPRMDGRVALRAIRETPALRLLPVVVLTTSRDIEDIRYCYETGANSFMTKPSRFQDLIDAMRKLEDYWANVVNLPPSN